ncbi:MAG: hypothetical protein RBU37_21375 [Myxococcota bacterium]|nr:hypothetical protein [Myxococcota bacterium]
MNRNRPKVTRQKLQSPLDAYYVGRPSDWVDKRNMEFDFSSPAIRACASSASKVSSDGS